ncbi:putative Fe-S cluster assembly protein SufT [Amphritea atlantica]|uniref:Fe-S cluster assembly protein SufT n=1 Tax=Amphritea atlantica TaxID=355243 RepID=A0ABY5H071_9GAMM|nr:putative Fe-S cluster assembly protein SufT [Amphritea atlantica]
MQHTQPIRLLRDCSALLIPSGEPVTLPKGSEVSIQQALGDTYTVSTGASLARINSENADALGLIPLRSAPPAAEQPGEDVPVAEEEIQRQLRSCYDPEIPVNILDLGLIYSCRTQPHPQGGSQIHIDMTLTAPGCGMGAVLASDVERKLLQIPGVRTVDIRLVFDPPWDASRMSDAAKLQLGLL